MESEYTLRLVDREAGTVREAELTAAQTFDFMNGKPISYAVEEVPEGVSEDGLLVERESAVPKPPDAAA